MKRFKYHFEPKSGWMNDPNGLVEFNGMYHAFFQHNPHDIVWGPMHWGHAVSKDLIHWDELPIALFPDQEYENGGGCYSGSAIVKNGRLYLIYTSVAEGDIQTQSVAYSDDGITFTKYENNPVIKSFPHDDATKDFRDPKVFLYDDGSFRMIVGTVFANKGRVLQYKSYDLFNWEYVGVLFESATYNLPIECPDLYRIGSEWILMFSKIGLPNRQEQFILGDFDGIKFKPRSYVTPEFGPQFYAAQTFETMSGRRILIGWFYDWNKKAAPDDEAAGALTLPRELTVEDGCLLINPVHEADEYLCVCDPNELEYTKYLDQVKSEQNIEIEKIKYLIDEKTIEIFINDGRAVLSYWL